MHFEELIADIRPVSTRIIGIIDKVFRSRFFRRSSTRQTAAVGSTKLIDILIIQTQTKQTRIVRFGSAVLMEDRFGEKASWKRVISTGFSEESPLESSLESLSTLLPSNTIFPLKAI